MVQRACVSLAAVFLLTAMNVHAGVVATIDTFATQDSDQSLVVTVKKPDCDNQLAVSSVVGGYRDVHLHQVAGQPIHADLFAPADGDSGLFISQAAGQAAITTVTWDGENSPGVLGHALNTDLTTFGGNQFVLSVADVTGPGINVTMTIYSDNNSRYSQTAPVLVTGAGTISLPFLTSFTIKGGGGANLTDIDAIVLQLDGTGLAGTGVTVASLAIATPEPSTLMLAAVGALVFFGVGRKWRKT